MCLPQVCDRRLVDQGGVGGSVTAACVRGKVCRAMMVLLQGKVRGDVWTCYCFLILGEKIVRIFDMFIVIDKGGSVDSVCCLLL